MPGKWIAVLKRIPVGVWMYFAVQTLFLLLIREPAGQDADIIFSHGLDQQDLFQFLGNRWDTWSSRLVIEGVLAVLTHVPVLFFLLNYLLSFLLLYSVLQFLPKAEGDSAKKAANAAAVVLLLYPFYEMSSAGWIATLANYYWPLVLGVYAMTPLAALARGEKVSVRKGIFCLLAMIYAANMEQSCALLAGILLLWCVYAIIREKKLQLLPVLELAIAVFELVMILICPGNRVRMSQEMNVWIRDFAMYTTQDKLNLGFQDTMNRLFHPDPVFLIFCIVLSILIFMRERSAGKRLISLIPPVLLLLYSPTGERTMPNFLHADLINRNLDITTYMDPAVYIKPILFAAVLLILYLEFLYLSKTKKEWITVSVLFSAGLMSRVMMGFSSSIFNSGSRTMIYFSFIVLILMLHFLCQNQKKATFYITGIGAVLMTIGNLSYIATLR